MATAIVALHGCAAKPLADAKASAKSAAARKAMRSAAEQRGAVQPSEDAEGGEATTIVLADSGELFRALAGEIVARCDTPTQVVDLAAQRQNLSAVLAKNRGPVVAIGLDAALAIPRQSGRDVIFALVFNHGDNRLLERG